MAIRAMPPWFDLSGAAQLALVALMLVSSLVLGGILSRASNSLKPTLPRGIVSLEAPRSSARAACLLKCMTSEQITSARWQVRWDFPFLVCYSLFLSIAAGSIAQRTSDLWQFAGILLSWGGLLAGAWDAVEDVSILQMLKGRTGVPWPQLSTLACVVKFTLLGAALAYVVVGVLVFLFRSARGVLAPP